MENKLISFHIQKLVVKESIDNNSLISKDQPFKRVIETFSTFCALNEKKYIKESLINYGFASMNFDITSNFFLIKNKLETLLLRKLDEENNDKKYFFRLKQTIQGKNNELTKEENENIKYNILYYVLSYFICPCDNTVKINDENLSNDEYIFNFKLNRFFLHYLPEDVRSFITVKNDKEMLNYWNDNNITEPFLTSKWLLDNDNLAVTLINTDQVGVYLSNLKSLFGKTILQEIINTEVKCKFFFYILEKLSNDYAFGNYFYTIKKKAKMS